MAATVTCPGGIIDECDAVTGWSNTDGVYTADPTPVEADGCLSLQVSQETQRTLLTVSADYSSKTLYQWFTHRAALASLAAGGVAVFVSDGTNQIAYHVGGYDKAVFRHDDGPAYWQNACLDTDSPPSTYTEVAGSEASLDWSSITGIGWQFITTAKSVGGAENCFWDVMRECDPGEGLTITGGTSGTPGTFADVAAADRSTGHQQAFGMLRELGVGLYGAQASLNFGSASEDSWFEEDGFALVFEARGFADDKLKVTMTGGESSYESHLVLKNGSIISAESAVSLDFTASNITEIDLSNTVVDLQGGTLSCGTDSYAQAGQTYDGAVVRNSGVVNFGQTSWLGATIKDSTVAADESASRWDAGADPDGWVDGLTVEKGATDHHAVALGTSSPTSVTYRNCTFTGFSASHGQNSSTFSVERTTGSVTINIIDCTGNFTYKSAGASVTVSAPKTASVHVEDEDGNSLEGLVVYLGRKPKVKYTSGAGNSAGSSTLVVTESIPGDVPQVGRLEVFDFTFLGWPRQTYRWQSHDGSNTFTLRPEVTYACTGGGTSTSLQDTGHDFTALDIEVGDTVRNVTDGSWAVVREIVDANNITTSPLRGGSDNTWTSGDVYSFHRLATTLVSGVDIVDLPYINAPTDASGDVSAQLPTASAQAVTLRVRGKTGGTKYLDYVTAGNISAATGFSYNVVMEEDAVST